MDLPSWARVGAKVVCIDAGPPRNGMPIKHNLVAGQTYVISDLCTAPFWSSPGVRVAGLRWPHNGWADLSRFRPLVDQQTDIATHFAHHLKQPEKV